MFYKKIVELDKIKLFRDYEIKDSPKFDYSKSCHILNPDGTFDVNQKKDGKSKSQHLSDIEYIKSVIKKTKIMPPLVFKKGDKYLELDGFKRLMAYKQLNYKKVEVIVCDKLGETNGQMVCRRGGQSYKIFKDLTWMPSI